MENSVTVSDNLESEPSVWAGCLASYNAGMSHGRWIVVSDVETMQCEISDMLLESPAWGAEEWHICDFDNFAPFPIECYESLENIVAKADAIRALAERDELDVFCAWYAASDGVGYGSAEAMMDAMEESFRGKASSGPDYAYDFFVECGDMPDAPLCHYIDWEAVWRDMEIDGYRFVPITYRSGYVFSGI